MSKRCTHVESNGFHRCGSYAFNLEKDGIEQGDLCDVHYWQDQALSARAKLTEQPVQQEPVAWLYWKVDNKSVVTGPFKTHSKDDAYGRDCIDQTLITVTTPQAQRKPLTEQAFEALHCKAKGYVQTGLMDVVRIVEHHHNIRDKL